MFLALVASMVMTMTADEPEPMHTLVKEVKVATLSTSLKGTPFGSLVAYSIDSKGRPYIFISDLAVHTKNIKKSNKVSLMVYKEDKDDLFNSQRITFVGKMVKVDDKEREVLKKEYLERHPSAEQFIDFGDFNFYRLEVERIHCIGGFGDIEWVEPEAWSKSWTKNASKKQKD
jgi:putative heme iron utilization protein